ncbi:putative Major Facilitator Superfamily [Paratrimastix pyriformis]|uniref:Major Facilitator Superfamily n=1 Tax=Paratrimastix pyriformis TaxID=342808 RepID=A0ABQ8URL9_9EUKA|nr:putative Major Facilitator Superfamily [Paratrimastix pyriformis]
MQYSRGSSIWIFICVFIFALGGGLPQAGFPFFLKQDLALSASSFGHVFVAFNFGLLMSSFVCGIVSDHVGRPPVILACFILDAVALFLIPFSYSSITVALLRWVMGFTNAGLNMCGTLVDELLPSDSRSSDKSRAQSQLLVFLTAGILGGTFFSSQISSFRRACTIGCLLELVAAGIGLSMWPLRARGTLLDRTPRVASQQKVVPSARWWSAHLTTPFVALCGAQFLLGFGQSPIESTLPLYAAARDRTITSRRWSLMQTIFQTCNACSQALLATRTAGWLGVRFAVMFGILGLAACWGLFYSVGRTAVTFALIEGLYGIVQGILSPNLATLGLTLAAPQARGTLLGLLNAVACLGRVMGPLYMNPLFGIRTGLLFNLVSMATVGAAFLSYFAR